jgi:hypothetical protein
MAKMAGWIKVHRRLQESDTYKQLNSKQRDVFLQILLMANYEANVWTYKGEVYEVKRGQLVTSIASIKENCSGDVTDKNIRTTLDKLVKLGVITNKSTKRGRLITIVNWDIYQGETGTKKQADKRQSKQEKTAGIETSQRTGEAVDTEEIEQTNSHQLVNKTAKPNRITDEITAEIQASNKELKELNKKSLKDIKLISSHEINQTNDVLKRALQANQPEQPFSFFNLTANDLNMSKSIPVNLMAQPYEPYNWVISDANNPSTQTKGNINSTLIESRASVSNDNEKQKEAMLEEFREKMKVLSA